MKRRVVITGIGAITPLGIDAKSTWENIKVGKCGIDEITAFDTSEYKVSLAAEVKNFNPVEMLDKKSARRMDRFSQFAMVAAKEAVKSSALDCKNINNERFGVMIGSGIGGIITLENEFEKLLKKGPNRVAPLLIPEIIVNMAAGNVAIEFGAKAICTSTVTACATGTHSIGEAYKTIINNEADIMIAGGTEASISRLSIAGFAALKALSKSKDKTRASIPFDKERDGFVMGEGAGAIVLETLEHAKKRGVKILAEIVGYGATCDAYHMTAPAQGGEGAARAIKLCLDRGGILPDEVSYINAHGTSTQYNDMYETEAIKSVFKQKAYDIPISSTKSMHGHLLGATGAVEAIICVKSLQDSFIPPTIGYKVPDEKCDLDYVPNIGRKKELKYVLSNSLGFGGHNATILLKKWED